MNDIELAVLSIIATGTRYGHEIPQVIDRRGLRNWISIGNASIFYVLGKLEAENLIHGELPFEDLRSARKRYDVTDAGRAVLVTAVMDLLTRARGGVGGFELGLLASSALTPDQVRHALYQRRIELARQLEKTIRTMETHEPEPNAFDIRGSLYERAIALLEMDLEWLTNFEAAWEEYHESAAPFDYMASTDVFDMRDIQKKQTHGEEDAKTDTIPPVKRVQKMERPKDVDPPQEE